MIEKKKPPLQWSSKSSWLFSLGIKVSKYSSNMHYGIVIGIIGLHVCLLDWRGILQILVTQVPNVVSDEGGPK